MINPLDALLDLPEDDRRDLRLSWATVTGIDPLKIRLDHESHPLIGSPSTLEKVSMNDRVYVAMWGGRVVVLGRKGGSSAPTAPVWQGYTPQLETDGFTPVSWTGSAMGRYLQVGGLVTVEIHLIIESFTSRGSGNYQVTLPVTPVGYDGSWRTTLSGEIAYEGRVFPLYATIENNSGRTMRLNITSINDGRYLSITHSRPDPWTSGRIQLNGSYRGAA